MKRVICILGLCSSFVQAQNNFEIVFSATPKAPHDTISCTVTDEYLDSVKSWGGTGISLFINWWAFQVDVNSPTIDYSHLDATIFQILAKDLDVYFRVAFGQRPISAITNSSEADWLIDTDGNPFKYDFNGNDSLEDHEVLLNFASAESKKMMLDFYDNFLGHLDSFDLPTKARFKYITPSVSHDYEMEYPYEEMCGFSSTELSLFREYLLRKYQNLATVNAKWGTNFINIDDIDPKSYYWNDTTNANDTYPRGRIDWLNFRTSVLKNFIDTCAYITKERWRFHMILQLGSTYDNQIENRGWVDPTSLMEKPDLLMVGEIASYKHNFWFSADYSRSICKFWGDSSHKFGTETNWPDFDGRPSEELCEIWGRQLDKFFCKGAVLLNVVGWDRNYGYPDSTSKTILDSGTVAEYGNWRRTLKNTSEKPVQSVSYAYAVHLGCERLAYTHNRFELTQDYFKKFDILTSVEVDTPYLSNPYNYNGQCDIVTNYMIAHNPRSLIFTIFPGQLWFNKSSEYITDEAYLALMRTDLSINSSNVAMFNATHWVNNGIGVYAYTMGIKNERNQYRSPIHLIWRTRPDLQAIWPSASLPARNSGIYHDFIKWANDFGCGNYFNPPIAEYPGWTILANRKYNYDENIRGVWNGRSDLQTVYKDAHYQTSADESAFKQISSSMDQNSVQSLTTASTMIEWARLYGYIQDTINLRGYENWPYIGGTGLLPKTIEIADGKSHAFTIRLLQNYPNPFNPTTNIRFTLTRPTSMSIIVYDLLGREVKVLFKGEKEPGEHTLVFDGADLPSGLYFYKLQTGAISHVRKMLLVR